MPVIRKQPVECKPGNEGEDSSDKVIYHTTFCVNGNKYTGPFKDGKKHGKGTYHWKKSGNIYDGDFKDDFRDGYGTLSVKTKTGAYRKEYIGSWKLDRKDGFGTNFYSDTVSYEGEWICGKRHGWGRMISADCSVYEGEWELDKMSGTGILLYANGHRYEGSFREGMKDGEGKYFYCDKGQVYAGLWVDDVAKCGAMSDFDRESVPDATPFPIPVLTLTKAEEILDESKQMFIEKAAESR